MRCISTGFTEVRFGWCGDQRVVSRGYEYGFKTNRRWVMEGKSRLPQTYDLRMWCVDQFGVEDERWAYFYDTYWFHSAAHALAFKLRWV